MYYYYIVWKYIDNVNEKKEQKLVKNMQNFQQNIDKNNRIQKTGIEKKKWSNLAQI